MKRALFATIVFALFIGCSAKSRESFDSLNNKGILPLSSTNAYVGSNLFLADEFTRSTHLFNFLKERGAPAALELESTRFGDPHLLMYYPHDKQVFMADLHTSDREYQWIIRGPFQIEHKDYRELARTLRSEVAEPQFFFHGRLFRFRPTAEELAKLNPTPEPTPTPAPVKKPAKKISKVITKLQDVSGTPTPRPDEPFKPLNSDQQAIAMAQGYAERASNGDVIHTVTGESETFERIAEWYTGSASNFREIAKLNGFAEGTKPQPGARIEIPLKLVKQFKAMK